MKCCRRWGVMAQVRPGLAKMAVPKALFPFILKYEAALRACLDRPEAAAACRRRGSLDGGTQASLAEVNPLMPGGQIL